MHCRALGGARKRSAQKHAELNVSSRLNFLGSNFGFGWRGRGRYVPR